MFDSVRVDEINFVEITKFEIETKFVSMISLYNFPIAHCSELWMVTEFQ